MGQGLFQSLSCSEGGEQRSLRCPLTGKLQSQPVIMNVDKLKIYRGEVPVCWKKYLQHRAAAGRPPDSPVAEVCAATGVSAVEEAPPTVGQRR